jgi:hypothetical protein
MRYQILALTIVSLSLSGCAQRWVKPGATEGDFKIAQARCEAIGYQKLPTRMHWMQISSGYTTQGYNRCTGSGANRRCYYTPGTYQPPRYGNVDQNEQARTRLVEACLFEDGWVPAS